MGYIGKNYGIYWAKTICYSMGYICKKMGYNRLKVWDILVQNFGINYGICWLKIVGYILENYGILWSIGYIKRTVKDILGK